MGGAPLSVGDGMSWAWSKFKENALILVVGMGLWTVLSNFTVEAHYTVNGEEHGFSLGVPYGTYIAFAIGLFASTSEEANSEGDVGSVGNSQTEAVLLSVDSVVGLYSEVGKNSPQAHPHNENERILLELGPRPGHAVTDAQRRPAHRTWRIGRHPSTRAPPPQTTVPSPVASPKGQVPLTTRRNPGTILRPGVPRE